MNLLGVQTFTVLFPKYDTILDTLPIVEVVKAISAEINSFLPTEVFIPLISSHQDHKVTYEACLAALRPSIMPHCIELIVGYEYPASGWGDETFLDSGKSGMFVDITKYLEKKNQALMCYKTQIVDGKHCFSIEAATAMAKMRGIECGMEYAEMFRVMRSVSRT